MKKLFFLLGFVICLSFTSSAQSFMKSEDAINSMKEAIATGQTSISLTDERKDAVMVSSLKYAAVTEYTAVVIASGNNQENFNALFEGQMFRSERIKPELVAEAKSFLLKLVAQ